MENIVRTIYGSYLQAVKLMDRPFTLKPNTTLNEKFGIQQNVAPDAGTIPSMKYWGIGNGGHALSVGVNSLTKTEPVQHQPHDAALYNHLPFVMRELTNDINSTERQRYGLRRIETHGGKQYAAYYLKRLDFTNTTTSMLNVHVEEGVKTSTAFSATTSNLNPTPPEIDPEEVNSVDGDYVSVSHALPISLSAGDITEFINAAKVLYDDDDYAIISEICLVSGLDKAVTSPAAGGGTINFNEVIAAQVCSFVNTFFAAKYSNNSIGLLLDVGATEPLFHVVS